MSLPVCEAYAIIVHSLYYYVGVFQVFWCHAFSECAFRQWHSHTVILRLHILTLPFSQCPFSCCHSHNVHSHYRIYCTKLLSHAFSCCHSQNSHYHTAILRMHIFTLHFQDAHSYTAILIYIYVRIFFYSIAVLCHVLQVDQLLYQRAS